MESGKPDLNIASDQRKRSTSSTMAVSKEELMELGPDDVFEFEVEKLDATLKELNISGYSGWKKSKKAHELIKFMESMKNVNEDEKLLVSSDPNIAAVQALQMIQQQNQEFMTPANPQLLGISQAAHT